MPAFDLHLALGGGQSLTDDVYQQLKDAVLEGRLQPGQALPSTRALAKRLSLSRNTVTFAFERLTFEGYLVTRVGSGTFVADARRPGATRPKKAESLRPRPALERLAGTLKPRTKPAAFDFRTGAPDPSLFPWTQWRSLVANQLKGRRPVVGYPPPEGDETLREAIARHLGVTRGITAAASDVLITSGAQQAFDLIAKALVEPGDCVAVEDPGYPSVRAALQLHGARVVPVPVDDEGLLVERIPNEARLVYVTPSHQDPLGMRLSLPRRLALLAWGGRRNAAILEDDYDTEFRFDGRPLESLHALDRDGRVIYVGTFSKVLLPTLRLGFLVAPANVMPALKVAKRLSDSHGTIELQRALADFLTEGLFARHVKRLHRLYGERREALHAAAEEHLGRWLVPVPSVTGLHVTFVAPKPVDDEAWAQRARAKGVEVEALSPYCLEAPQTGLVAGFGLLTPAQIREGLALIASVAPKK